MRFNLRTFVLAPVVMAAAALATQSAQAATSIVKIPFSFTVSGKVCPAGLYTVRTDVATHLITLQSKENTSRSFMWVIGPGDSAPRSNQLILKFDPADQTHALRSIQYDHMITAVLDNKPNENPAGMISVER